MSVIRVFGIESNFVEKNPDKVKLYNENYKLQDDEIKILTNDVAGSAGKPHWYVMCKKDVPRAHELFDKYKVVLPSVNMCRLHQIDLIYPNEIFARAKRLIKAFDTELEAKNFIKYCSSVIISYCFLLTGGSNTIGGSYVPDFLDYLNTNLLNWNEDIDLQLIKLLSLTTTEFNYIKQHVSEKVKNIREEISL